MFLRSSLFFPPTKNASVSRKGQADMPWPRVAVTVLCRSGRAMLSGSKSSPKRSTRTHRLGGREPGSMRSDLRAARCRLQRPKPSLPTQEKRRWRKGKRRLEAAVRAGSRSRAVEGGTRRPASAMQFLSPRTCAVRGIGDTGRREPSDARPDIVLSLSPCPLAFLHMALGVQWGTTTTTTTKGRHSKDKERAAILDLCY